MIPAAALPLQLWLESLQRLSPRLGGTVDLYRVEPLWLRLGCAARVVYVRFLKGRCCRQWVKRHESEQNTEALPLQVASRFQLEKETERGVEFA